MVAYFVYCERQQHTPGELLRKAAAKSDLSITQISKRAHFNRSSFYNHILNSELDLNILKRYGKAMGHDFSKELPEMISYITFEEPEGVWGDPLSPEDVIKDRDRWKDKYLQLLERYNKLIEERLEQES